MPQYEVENFVVYEVTPGGRRECAYIDERGRVVPYDEACSKLVFPQPAAGGSGAVPPAPAPKKKVGWGKIIVIIVLTILCAALGMWLIDTNKSLERKSARLESARQEVKELTEESEKLRQEILDMQRQLTTERDAKRRAEADLNASIGKIPFVLKDIKIGNVYNDNSIETHHGGAIYSKRTMFLQPKISYYGLTNGTRTIDVKWMKPNGDVSVQRGNTYTFSKGENTITLKGWGNKNKGYWPHGTYRVEIWCGDVCLGSTQFNIWS